MGNVQSDATQESESTKEREEKTHPDPRSKPPDRVPNSSGKHEPESRPPGPQLPEPKTASQPLSSEPGGGDRPAGAPEMGKSHSKKSKLKLSSMWTQNSASGGMKAASLCDKDPGVEKRGLACISRADLQGRPVAAVQKEPKGLKVVLWPPQGAASETRDLSLKRTPVKGKSKLEASPLDQNLAGLVPKKLQPGPPVLEPDRLTEAPKDVMEMEVCWTQHVQAGSKEHLQKEDHPLEMLSPAKKEALSGLHSPEPSKATEEASPGPRILSERSTGRPVPSGCMALPGRKKALLSWGAGPKEKEKATQTDGSPGCDGDSQGLALVANSLLPTEPPQPLSSLVEKPQASESEGKAGPAEEPLEAEAVSSETMQELLEKGLNFLYKVTIQPGQWPPSIKPVKQKPNVLSSGVSYADVLKQCPQKKPPAAGAPALPKALYHLSAAGNKLPSFKGIERSNPEDFSSLSQLFLEHFKKGTPKEPAPHAAGQQVVTFIEEISTTNPKRTEWQRPRPPTPYPQRRKGQGKKLVRFGTAVSQVMAFLGSDPKCDWFVHDENPVSLVAGDEGGRECADPPDAGAGVAEEVAYSPPIPSLLLEQEIPMEIDDFPTKPRSRPQGLEEIPKETSPVKMVPCNVSRGVVGPLAAPQPLPKEEQSPVPLLAPVPRETPELPSPASAPMHVPTGLVPDLKAPAPAQARPKVRKQGPAAPKAKEKAKASGQPKAKAPKGKGHKPWPRSYGMTPTLRLEGSPLFPPFEKVARPFYFGETLETPLTLDKPAGIDSAATSTQASPEDVQEADRSPAHHWPAFQVSESCPMRCYCRHQAQRKLPKNVVAWLNPSTNHLAEPPWVATAMLAVSLVAGTKFCLDSYEQQHVSHED